jgi:predicted nuclease of predicted toxin-antitoxin system
VRLLFDNNLSFKLVPALDKLFPGSGHVRQFGLEKADDTEVWEFAKKQGYTIVSKDDDFHQRSFLYGPPPKVVWVRLGNCSTAEIEKALRGGAESLAQFEVDPMGAFMVLSRPG